MCKRGEKERLPPGRGGAMRPCSGRRTREGLDVHCTKTWSKREKHEKVEKYVLFTVATPVTKIYCGDFVAHLHASVSN